MKRRIEHRRLHLDVVLRIGAMVNEIGTGATYLASLKQSPKQAAAKEASHASQSRLNAVVPAESQSGEKLPSRKGVSLLAENRATPRYRCQGSAHLREVAGGVATWATITDIGLRGCYVEITTCFRVGTALALTIEVNGLRVEARGEVRVAYPGLGVGISFGDISSADRESLRTLIVSLSGISRILGSPPALATAIQDRPNAAPEISDPSVALQALVRFFGSRDVIGRDEFFRIVRKSQ